ncbi:unnamed protein product [Mytilus coruscus]|uniref:Farnesoic acid O-methyl transferase domain-containing protein n=1 Tax=Mytilus coruscus TaxID=42192 RepID=A0A6J8A8E1_MYTCO|nr:unnamed protein product [Mytilus coruscus]
MEYLRSSYNSYIIAALYGIKLLSAITIHTDNVGKKASRNYQSNEIYTQLTPYGILPVGDVFLEFKVKACNDAFVLLSSASDLNSTFLYEIVIGSRSNTAIFLRRKYGGITALMSGIKAIVLFCDEYTELFVNWSNSGRITIGNDSHTFIDWTDPYPFMIEGYGIMTGWGADGSWIFNFEASDTQTRLNAGDTQTHLEASNTQTHLKASDTQTHLKTSDTQTHLEASDTQTHLEASDTQTHLEASDTQTHLEASDTQTHLETSDTQTHLEAIDTQTHLEAIDTQTHSFGIQ